MNRKQFISFMESPDKLSATDGTMLSDLLKDFPYFQTAYLLYSKSLHNQNSIHYNNQLKITAAYATDRKVLHRLITKKQEPLLEKLLDIVHTPIIEEKVEQMKAEQAVVEMVKAEVQEHQITPVVAPTLEINTKESAPKEELEIAAIELEPIKETPLTNEKISEPQSTIESVVELPVKEDLSELEKEYLSTAADATVELELLHSEEVKQETEPELTEIVESNFVLNNHQEKPVVEEVTPQKKANNDFNANSPHSFSDWLKHAAAAETSTEHEEKPKDEKQNRPLSDFDLIDKFIKEEPKISRGKAEFFNPVNMARQSVADDITFVSETLAKIYVLQGNYVKALDAYETLRLKYPEKRLYFATQIKNIRKLINQQKS